MLVSEWDKTENIPLYEALPHNAKKAAHFLEKEGFVLIGTQVKALSHTPSIHLLFFVRGNNWEHECDIRIGMMNKITFSGNPTEKLKNFVKRHGL